MDLLILKVEANISMQLLKRKQRERNFDYKVRIILSSKRSYINIPTKINYSLKSSVRENNQ